VRHDTWPLASLFHRWRSLGVRRVRHRLCPQAAEAQQTGELRTWADNEETQLTQRMDALAAEFAG
jgi:hypothetical protein